ncbi:flagellar biosynthetic protein FliO [Bordetella sp. 2513F-2]
MTEAAVLRVVAGLVLVVAAILMAAWLARRSGLMQRQDGSVLRMVGSLALGPRQRIAVIQVQDTWLVVGLTPGGMTALHTLPAGTVPAPDAGTPLPAFAATLAQRLGKAVRRP